MNRELMNVRIIPCAVCRTPLAADSVRSTNEGSPELLLHPNAWFGIMTTDSDPPKIGMLLCCSRPCAEQMASSSPVMQGNTPIGVG